MLQFKFDFRLKMILIQFDLQFLRLCIIIFLLLVVLNIVDYEVEELILKVIEMSKIEEMGEMNLKE